MLHAPDISKPPRVKKRACFSSSSFSSRATWRQIKVPWLSGSGVGRVVSGSPLSPPQQSLLLSSSAAQNAREEEEEEGAKVDDEGMLKDGDL